MASLIASSTPFGSNPFADFPEPDYGFGFRGMWVSLRSRSDLGYGVMSEPEPAAVLIRFTRVSWLRTARRLGVGSCRGGSDH
jgi:hypothetical protein